MMDGAPSDKKIHPRDPAQTSTHLWAASFEVRISILGAAAADSAASSSLILQPIADALRRRIRSVVTAFPTGTAAALVIDRAPAVAMVRQALVGHDIPSPVAVGACNCCSLAVTAARRAAFYAAIARPSPVQGSLIHPLVADAFGAAPCATLQPSGSDARTQLRRLRRLVRHATCSHPRQGPQPPHSLSFDPWENTVHPPPVSCRGSRRIHSSLIPLLKTRSRSAPTIPFLPPSGWKARASSNWLRSDDRIQSVSSSRSVSSSSSSTGRSPLRGSRLSHCRGPSVFPSKQLTQRISAPFLVGRAPPHNSECPASAMFVRQLRVFLFLSPSPQHLVRRVTSRPVSRMRLRG